MLMIRSLMITTLPMIRTLIVAVLTALLVTAAAAAPTSNGAPRYVVDPFWPKDLPENWTLGQVAGVAGDAPNNRRVLAPPGSPPHDTKGAPKNAPRPPP